jgi:uncharacterized membrane protein YidH (DUF202 family)
MEEKAIDNPRAIDAIIINEVQLLLAEKRTSLSVMRTGIAVLALPMSVTSLLIATSKYYSILQVIHFLIPLSLLNIALAILGLYLIVKSMIKMKSYDRHIAVIKKKHSVVGEFIN